MSLLFNRRDTLAIGIVALLLFAAAAPLCLMPASPAMAMQLPGSPSPSQDCDAGADADGGSMKACPYMGGDEVPAASPTVGERTTSLALLPALPVEPVTAGADRGAPDDRACLSHAPAPLIPLRV